MKTLTLDAIIYIHKQTIARHGGLDGIRDLSLIESSLETPFLTYLGEDLNKTDIDKISAITYSLIKNHGFRDGNKRVGTITMGVLCKMNGIHLKYTQQELIDFGLGVASGSMSKEDIKIWIESHME